MILDNSHCPKFYVGQILMLLNNRPLCITPENVVSLDVSLIKTFRDRIQSQKNNYL